ncbi:MAG: NAD(P)H-hydrate dehydratase, partial [Firmicutes bacterium]|nr:NAD(P)H-hydrate dehydratase [Bacillota bacterium]
MKILSSEAMKAYDRETIEEFGLPGAVLMETAGSRVAEFVRSRLPDLNQVVVIAGPGNNGGDGLVIARLLTMAGYQVSLWSTLRPGAYRGEAAVFEKYLLKTAFPIQRIHTHEELQLFVMELKNADLLVDALLGTGISREVEGLIAAIIEAVNSSDAPVLAVDVPSGINADNGAVMGNAVRARWTLTFAFPKLGLLLQPGASLAGEIYVGEIYVPAQLAEAVKVELLTPSLIRSSMPPRPPNAHKGSLGRSIIIAGSPGMTGAAVLTAESALRGGSGLVYLAAPESVCPVLESKLLEVIIVPLPESSPGIISPDAADLVLARTKECDALAIGPGLDTGAETAELINRLVQLSPVPLVLDAGALTALGQNMNILRSARFIPVVTPHPGEMARLAGVSAKEVQSSRLAIALKNANFWNCNIVLKGANSVISTPDGYAAINPTGSVTLATAGSGDLLTGLITSFIAQGICPEKAAMAGTYIHGLAGDLLP